MDDRTVRTALADDRTSSGEGTTKRTKLPSSTRSSAAYAALRWAIVHGVHSPGEKLLINEMASKLGVGPGAIREALSKLVAEDFVVARDQRGFAVAPCSLADLDELTDLRCEIDGVALRRSVRHGDLEWEAQLVAALHRLHNRQRSDTGTDQEARLWATSQADFHNALVSACGSRRLLVLRRHLYDQTERYRCLSACVGCGPDLQNEHREMVELALARDAERLVEMAVVQIRRTSALISALHDVPSF